MAGKAPSFIVDQARVAVLVGCLTIAGFVWSAIGYLKSGEMKDVEQDGRISQSELNLGEAKNSINKLTEKTDELTKAVIRLTTVIEKQPMSDRAYLDQPSRPLLSLERASTRTE